jgi:hypothetical protein
MKKLFLISFVLLTVFCSRVEAAKLIAKGATSQTITVVIKDANGDPNDGSTSALDITNLKLFSQRDGAYAQTDHGALAAHGAATDAWDDLEAYHMGGGLYRVDVPDAQLDYGVGELITYIIVDTASHNQTAYYEVQLSPPVNIDAMSDDQTVPDSIEVFWDDATARANLKAQYDGTGYVGGTIVSQADVTKWNGSTNGITNWIIVYSTDFATNYDTTADMWNGDIAAIGGDTQSATDLKDFADAGYDPANDGTNVYTIRGAAPVSASDVVDEFETQSQADPTGFHVNVLEVGGTAQTANDMSGDIDIIRTDTEAMDTYAEMGALVWNHASTRALTELDEDNTTIDLDSTTVSASATVEYELNNTTIATLTTQTSFTLTDGSTDDDAYNDCIIIIEDASTADQKAWGVVGDYTGSTKTVTLRKDPGIFTMAATDKVYIYANPFGWIIDLIEAISW